MKKMSIIGKVAFILVIIGALNWGLVGFFNFNVVSAIFGAGSMVAHVVYAVIGLAALYAIIECCKCCRGSQ